MSASSVDTTELGDLLRHWRGVRRLSQLDLASEAGSTPRYVSFMETGRARPSRDPANALRLFSEPGPVRDAVTNWTDVVPGLLDRAHREAVGGVLDHATAALVIELQARPEIAAAVRRARDRPPAGPVIDVRFEIDGVSLAFFSLVTSVGTPIDVTAQELRVECFFPADAVTRDRWVELLAKT